MQKHNVVEPRDVDCREHKAEDDGDGEEEEFVAPEVRGPGAYALGHVEEGAAEVDELPGEQQEDPGHGSVAGGTGTEHLVAGRGVAVVAVHAKVAVVEAEEHDGE